MQATATSRLGKVKSSFVARAVVVAVSLFLVAFSLGAPAAAFADSNESSSAGSASALVNQNANSHQIATNGVGSDTNSNAGTNIASNAGANTIVPANATTEISSDTQNTQAAGAVTANVENSNVENSSASTSNDVLAPSTSGSGSAADAAGTAGATTTTTHTDTAAALNPAADEPEQPSLHNLNLQFKLLYQGPEFTDGYEIGSGTNGSYVCANGDSHASTSASNHMIRMADLIAQRDVLLGYLKAGFEIRGWTTSLDPSARVYTFEGEYATCTDGATIYIVATEAGPAATEFVLTYDGNGATEVPEAQSVITTESEYTFTISDITPTREGYSFVGWSLNSYTALPYYAPGSTVTVNASATLYAVWQLENQVTLTYMVDGNQFGAQEVYAENASAIVKDQEPTKEGYKFIG